MDTLYNQKFGFKCRMLYFGYLQFELIGIWFLSDCICNIIQIVFEKQNIIWSLWVKKITLNQFVYLNKKLR